MTPPVAVVIPVWDDYVRFLEEAVTSVSQQEAAPRPIVVDNASTSRCRTCPPYASFARTRACRPAPRAISA